MGQFESGKWVFGFALYFFVFFLVLYSVANAAETYDLEHNTQVADIGFQTQITPRNGGCVGSIPWSARTACSSVGTLDNNVTCNAVTGCSWTDGLFGSFCDGTPGLLFMGIPIGSTTTCPYLSQDNCEVFKEDGCEWIPDDGGTGIESTTVSPTQSASNKGVVNTIGFLFGFNATLGIPPSYQFIISFLFFWLPFFAMIWSVYMAIPFLH